METAWQPKGLLAISRGLNEATPPEDEDQLRPRVGSQIVLAPLQGATYNVSLAGGISLRPQPPANGWQAFGLLGKAEPSADLAPVVLGLCPSDWGRAPPSAEGQRPSAHKAAEPP